MTETKPPSAPAPMPDLAAFITYWDEAAGPSIIEQFPSKEVAGDLDLLGMNIFMTFQTVFGDATEVKFKKTSLVMPFKSRHQVAKILLDVISNPGVRGGLEPFLIVVLVSDSVSEDNLDQFNPVLDKTDLKFQLVGKKELVLPEYEAEFKNVFNTIKQMGELEVKLDPSYSLALAVADFKKGFEFFNKNNYKSAQVLLRTAAAKFEQENQPQLLMEAIYVLTRLMFQQKKYRASSTYAAKLLTLVAQVGHQKYQETAAFMQGFCNYSLGDFASALESFAKIDIATAQSVNKLQFFTLMGRSASRLDLYDKAIENLKQALAQIKAQAETEPLKMQRGMINFELGMNHYKLAIKRLKNIGFKTQEQNDSFSFSAQLKEAAEKMKAAIEIWETMGDFSNAIYACRMLGNVFAVLREENAQIAIYQRGADISEKQNDYAQYIKFIDQIYSVQARQLNHQKNLELLMAVLENTMERGVIDDRSMGLLHLNLGRTTEALGDQQNALMEYTTALNSYKLTSQSTAEQIEILHILIDRFQKKNETDKIEYYQTQLNALEPKITQEGKAGTGAKLPLPGKGNILGSLKDIWFFTVSGIEIFDYAPQLNFDPTLLGGFLSAIQNFNVEIMTKKQNEFIIADDRYMFYIEPGKPLYILGRSLLKIPAKLIEKTLQVLYQRFYQEYSKAMENFSGNVEPMKNFVEIIRSLDLNLIDE